MEEAFGGNRAEDVRAFAESIGRGDDVVDVFFETIVAGLKELPRAGDTAANAIENLGDTTQRVQAVIGANFLPLVRETTAGLEGLLMEIEREPQIAKTIAIIEALGATFLTVAAAGTGLAAALPAIIAAVASLGAPILIPIAAVAALTAGLVALKVASRDIETQVERLAATFDELDEALRKNHEAIQSNEQAQVEAARSSLATQRDAIQKHITLLEEEQASIERTIAANRLRAERGLLPIASTGESFATQLDNANARLDVTQKRLQEVNDALRANEEASIPIQKTTANIGALTKAVTRLKTELEEETTFEGISQSITGDTANFQKSATALADIEVLIKSNTDAFTKLGEAAASGNQQAIKGINDLNESLNELRETQADRHVDNLSTAFNSLTNTTDSSRKQFEAILKSAEAFVATFQGGAAVLQDDVGQVLTLIGNIRSQLQDLSSDEITLELHAEGAEDLTRALTDFHDLQRDVQEDATLDARQSAEQQATAYIRAYRDSIDPAILNLVESVKLLREEVRGSIQDLEALNLQDKLRIELNEENLSPVADFFTELVDLQQAAQGGLTRSQIDSLEKRSQALRQYLYDDTAHFGAYASDIEAIDETLTDKSLYLLEGVVQARQAQYDDDLKAQRQAEQAKRQENEKTYDFDVFLAGLRRDSRKEAREDLTRLEGRALDASSQSQRENLIRETQQFVGAYAERGEAFRDLVADAQDLGDELQQAFDFEVQTRRLEDFRDGVAGVLENLAGIAIDHVFDSFSRFGAGCHGFCGRLSLMRCGVSLNCCRADITRLTRFGEDSETRRRRLEEDRDKRLAQLQRQRRTIAARGGGDQQSIERSRQRSQDLSFRIAEVRENFAVRSARLGEDTDTRRSRLIEDAELRRERFEGRGGGESLLPKLGDSLANSLSSAISSALASGLAGLLAGALQSPFQSLLDGIKELFGGGAGDGTQTATSTPSETTAGTKGDADVDGTIKALTVDPDLATPSVDVAGLIKSASQATDGYTAPSVDVSGLIKSAMQAAEGYTTPSIDVTGLIKSAVVDASYVPVSVEVKGLITSVMLAPGLQVPTVNLPGLVNQISVSPDATAPIINPAAVINNITTDPALTIPDVHPTAIVTDITVGANAAVPSVSPRGEIDELLVSPSAVIPNVDLTGEITDFQKSFVEPIPLKARADVELNLPDTDLLPPIDLGGLRFTNAPNIPITVTPEITGLTEAPEAPDKPLSTEKPITGVSSTGSRTSGTGQTTTADIVANEGRRQKIFGSGNPTVQTNITPDQLTKALVESQKESQLPSDFFNPFSAIADGIQSIAASSFV